MYSVLYSHCVMIYSGIYSLVSHVLHNIQNNVRAVYKTVFHVKSVMLHREVTGGMIVTAHLSDCDKCDDHWTARTDLNKHLEKHHAKHKHTHQTGFVSKIKFCCLPNKVVHITSDIVQHVYNSCL